MFLVSSSHHNSSVHQDIEDASVSVAPYRYCYYYKKYYYKWYLDYSC